MVKLSSVAEIINGDRGNNYPSNNDFVRYGIPFVNAGHLKDGVIDFCKMDFISKEKYEQLSGAKIQKNDILFCLRGSLGKYAVAEFDKGAPASSIAVIRPNTNKINLNYLTSVISSFIFQKQIELENNGSSQPNLSASSVADFEIPLPSLVEQGYIAEALSDMDNLISSLEKLIEKKKAIKQGAMQELLTGKRHLPGFSGEWQTFVFGELFEFIPNNSFTRAQLSTNGMVKNLHYGDILTKFGAYVDANSKSIPYISADIDLAKFAERCYLQSGDVIIADTAEDQTVGKALEVVNVDCLILAGQHTLLCRPKIRFANKFLGYYLNATCYHDKLLPYVVGTKVSSVSKASISLTELVVPQFEEQQAIAEILSDMDDEITALEQKLAKCQKLKQGMMQQLLTGKIRLVSNDDGVTDKPEVDTLKSSSKGHNHQFDDAVVIAGIVDKFYSDKYPLGRKKVQKLLYLFRRHQEADTSAFKKKAAGPYADEVRYKGGEPIAISSKYISVNKGTKGSSFSKGEKIADALTYLENWNLNDDIKWLCEQFKYIKTDKLELLATIDMAICDLNDSGETVTVDSIKNLIKSHPEWKAKLSKSYFKDNDISWAIKECNKLFN